MSEHSENSLARNASFLMAATLVSRVIGLLYRSPLGSILGSVGLGYYGYANNVYVILLLISSYSIPMAVSKVIAERLARKEYKNAQTVFHGALLYAVIVGGAAALVAVFFGSYLLPRDQQQALPALRTLAPTIFFSAILGVFRGYFQAHSTMKPTAVSQVLEQIANAVVSLLAAWLFIRSFGTDEERRAVYGAAGSALGTGIGVLVALLFLLLCYGVNRKTIRRRIERDRHEKEETLGDVMKVIVWMVTPIIFNTFVYNASSYLDSKIFSDILSLRGVAATTVSGEWGEYSNYYITLINIPLALSSATSSAMMPEIASRFAVGEQKGANEKINEGIRLTMFLCIPGAVGLAVLSEPIVGILFPAASALSARLLAVGAITVIFSALSTITNGVLQAIGQAKVPLRNSAASLVLNVACVAALSYLFPQIGVFSVLAASLAFSVCMCVLNAFSLKRFLGHKNDIVNGYAKPLAASAGMGAAAWILYYGLHLLVPVRVVCLGVAVIGAILLYLVLYVAITKTPEEEMKNFPMGGWLVRILRLLGVYRKRG